MPPAGLVRWIGRRGQAASDRYSEVRPPWPAKAATCKHVGGVRAKSRARRWPVSPRRAKPKGASSRWSAKHRRRPGTLDRVKTQEPRPAGPARSLRRLGIPAGQTVGGFTRAETPAVPVRRRKLRRVNPTSAVGTKQGRPGRGRRKPPRGYPNPAGGPQRAVRSPRRSGLPSLACAEGSKSPGERLAGCGRLTRTRWARLRGRRNPLRGCCDRLTVDAAVRRRKTARPRQGANGEAGSRKQ